jgi:hypothetical protein
MSNVASPYVDGYVFYEKKSSWMNVCRLWQKGTVRFASKILTGDDVIVAFVGEDAGRGAETRRDAKLRDAENAANPSFTSAKSTLTTASAPSRWSEKQPYAAHLRIKAKPGKAQEVYDAFVPGGQGATLPQGRGYNGHALCEGHWDVLVELGANSEKELGDVVARAQAVPNAASIAWIKVTTMEMPRVLPAKPEKCEPWT